MRINHVDDDDRPRLSDVRARLAALEHADRVARVETAMTIVPAQSILDLTTRPSARDRTYRAGASVWYREDVRLADGASRVVPAIFAAYAHGRRRCAIVRTHAADGGLPRVWVAVDDVFARHWADDVEDDRPRLAWVASPIGVDLEAGPILPLAVVVVAVLLGGLVALWRFWS